MAKDSTGTILLFGGAALAFYGYQKGWFANLFPATAAAPAQLTPEQQAAIAAGQVAQAAAAANAAAVAAQVPALGTKVTTAANALRQVAANDSYILPDAATFAQLQGALPSGYGWILTTDNGGILLRPDVYAAVNAVINARVKRAADEGAAASSIQQAGNVTLAEIQGMMTTAGLSGLGDYQRHIASRTGRILPFRYA